MDYGNFVGFETIGNATLIAYDNKPILATDPWLSGHAFFGSFGIPMKYQRFSANQFLNRLLFGCLTVIQIT